MEKIEKVLTFDEMERDYKDLNLMLKYEKGLSKRGSAYVLASFTDDELASSIPYASSFDFYVEMYRTSCPSTNFVSYMGKVSDSI